VYPAWSPDCRRIVFNSDRDGVTAVYSMRADGADLRRLTKDGHESLRPDWSPDGRRIAFGRSLDATNDEIFVIKADGTDPVNLSRHPAAYGSPPGRPTVASWRFTRVATAMSRSMS
jgi:TolB protein